MPRKRISDIEILKLIDKKLSISEMAFKLGVGKAAISKRIKKLQERGLIELDIEESSYRRSLTLSDVKIFRLTEKGKMEVYKTITGGEAGVQLPRLRGVHNVQFKFKIKKRGDLWFDHSVVLKNWVKKYTWFGDIYVEQNGKEDNPSSLIIKFGLEESDPWKAAYKALETALKMKRIFEDMVGFELSDPVMIGKPKWEIVGDPVAKEVSKRQVVVTDIGAIDNTPEPGTLHFYDVNDVITYFQMPRKINEIEQKVNHFPDVAVKIAEDVAEKVAEKVAVEVAKSVMKAILNPIKSSEELKDQGEEILTGEEVHGYA
ncbi:MAG: winged helix-turn-helix transcriptional regulator [Thermoplasmata archaeon]|nr:winged helix-turn-helix transcriptional regulator [Thermoplasmata archaeon]